jgi:hypothetical protein
MSTQFLRALELGKVCPEGTVCHVYATLAEDASNSVFINIHTGINFNLLTVSLKALSSVDDGIPKSITLLSHEPFKMNKHEDRAKRNVHSLYFTNLAPDTMYSVSIIDPIKNIALYNTRYRTLPNEDGEELRLAIGGDVGFEAEGIA